VKQVKKRGGGVCPKNRCCCASIMKKITRNKQDNRELVCKKEKRIKRVLEKFNERGI